MSSSPRSKDSNGLRLVPAANDPMQEKLKAYDQALNALPKSLRQPIAEYVKQHVDMELAPAPVTKAAYWAQEILSLVSYIVLVGLFEIERHATINYDDFTDSLAKAGLRFLAILGVSMALSIVMRVQTRAFRLSSIFVSCACAYVGMVLADWLAPVLYFSIPIRWIADSLMVVTHFVVLIYWLHWFLLGVLPTTRAALIRAVSASICVIACLGVFALGYNNRLDEDEVPAAAIIPFAANIGEPIGLSQLVERNLAAATANAPDLVDEHVNRGRYFREARKYDKAVASYSAAIQAKPNDSGLYVDRGYAWMGAGKFQQAVQDFDTADTLSGKRKETYSVRATVLLAEKKYDDAISMANLSIAENGSSSRPYFLIGLANYYAGRVPQAVEPFKKALELSPKDLENAVWLEIVNHKLAKSSELLQQAGKPRGRLLSRDVADLFLGKKSVGELIDAANEKPDLKYCKDCRKCDANFYAGQWELLEGQPVNASKHFKVARATCDPRFELWNSAGLELGRLGLSQGAN